MNESLSKAQRALIHYGKLGDPENEAIYQQIFATIVDHSLPPGTKLKEETLCEIFGVGRTRIRKILFQLANDNIVTLVPNRGAYVAYPSVAEAREVFTARRLVECHLVRVVAAEQQERARPLLEEHVQRERQARQAGDMGAAIRLCGEFHLLMAELADSPILGEFLRELISRTSLIVAIYERPPVHNCEMDEHASLIEAIAAGQAEQAALLMEEHLRGIESRLDLRPPRSQEVDIRKVLSKA
ncbi:MAG TPA: GntR family transcriptional regulator [Candidatus Competibacteraceae bacterium]|nr:GntR family transcriptional regulator [Candidatus Competibacteraceae bacterium]